MKNLILSPLFPPDTGAPAGYVKELATRLGAAQDTHLLVYGYLPEEISGVDITSVDKRASLPLRLLSFIKSLAALTSESDLILLNNAPSVELPFLIVTLFKKIPYTLIESDPIAKEASTAGFYKFLHSLIKNRAKRIVTLEGELLYKKEELLPFEEFDAAREARRQIWWENHLKVVTS